MPAGGDELASRATACGCIWPRSAMVTMEDGDVSQAVDSRMGEAGILDRISDVFFARPKLLTSLLWLPPLLWIGVVYVGSLFALLLQSFYSLDEFSGLIVHEFTLSTYAQLLRAGQLEIILRTVMMAALGHARLRVIAFPIAYYAARYARGWTKALFYLAVMMPLWSSYLVKVYAWKLILAKEGIITWLANGCICPGCSMAILAVPVIGGPSLSISYIGTFLVFRLYLDSLHDPADPGGARARARNYIEASADLGASPRQTFRTVIFPLALPGHHRRLDLHILADARRLHRSDHRRQFAPLHRSGGLHAAGNGRKHSARCRLHRRADGDHGSFICGWPSAWERSMSSEPNRDDAPGLAHRGHRRASVSASAAWR